MLKALKRMCKKARIFLLVLAFALSGIVSFSFVPDNYFNVSKNLDIFATLFRELNIYYVEETDPGDLMKTGIDAMLESLDPYTTYIPESKIEDYRIMTTGQYGGIGAVIQQRDSFVIVAEPYKGFPADKAGLKAGDVILEIDGKSVEGKSTTEVRNFLVGQPGTEVKVLIKRMTSEEPFPKTLIREKVKIDDVPYYGMLNDKTGYIKLTSFTETASQQFTDAFKDLRNNNNMEHLVFDLRGNGGGLLREAVNIVNVFVKRGQEVVSTRGRIEEWDKTHKALNDPLDTLMPLIVLVDEGSASASEIVSGALQDLDRAVILGRSTFGKGLVQQARPLSYNSKLKVTVAKYYIPSGRCIQKIDYSHRNMEGEAEEIPDSLKTSFKTLKNKRTVYDGTGINPDIRVKREELSNIARSLYTKMHIFDYATKYYYAHDEISPPEEFRLDDEKYKDFVAYLSDKEYDYTTRSEKLLDDLKKAAQEDMYYSSVKSEYKALKAGLKHNKKEDLSTFKGQISKILENEIVARYYYRKGEIRAALRKDTMIDRSLEIFAQKDVYSDILRGTYEPPVEKPSEEESEE